LTCRAQITPVAHECPGAESAPWPGCCKVHDACTLHNTRVVSSMALYFLACLALSPSTLVPVRFMEFPTTSNAVRKSCWPSMELNLSGVGAITNEKLNERTRCYMAFDALNDTKQGHTTMVPYRDGSVVTGGWLLWKRVVHQGTACRPTSTLATMALATGTICRTPPAALSRGPGNAR